MIHGLFQIKICFNIFRKNQDLQASCSFLFYMLLEIWTNSTATRRGSLGCWLQMGDAKKLLEIWCSMAWSATWWRTRLPPVKSEQHSSMQQALTQFKAFAGQGQPDKRIGKGKENESWKVLKNPVNPNVGWRFRVCRIKRYHVLAHVSTMLSPKYFTHCLFCSPFCKFIFYSNIRRDLFNATKRLIETCRSELHTLNPKCVFFFVPIIETFKVWFQVRFRAEDPNLAHPFAVGSTGHSFGGCRFKQLVGFKWCLHHKKQHFNISIYFHDISMSLFHRLRFRPCVFRRRSGRSSREAQQEAVFGSRAVAKHGWVLVFLIDQRDRLVFETLVVSNLHIYWWLVCFWYLLMD